MLSLKRLDATVATVADDDLTAFASGLAGTALGPDDPGYDAARKVWNSLIDRRPGLIVQCAGLADIVAAVRFANEHGILVAVRGGGHNVSGSAVCDDGLVIDLRRMNAVRVDRGRGSVHVQGGARLADIDRETQLFGLVTPTGNVSDTGIGGLALGGGMGNLRRKYGLSVDNMVSVEIVGADGEVRTASADENPNLFWAVRGGGGNFGVVTGFEFRLHPLGLEVMFAAQFFAIDDAPDVVPRWRDFVEAAPDEISSICFFWTVPALPAFPEAIHGQRVMLYVAMYAGPADEGEAALAPLQQIGTPILDLSGRGPYIAWQQAFDPFFVPGSFYPDLYAYWKSIYLGGLDDEVIDDLIGRARTMPSDQCLMALWHLGGAVARPAADATAFGKRSAPYLLSYDSCWIDPALTDRVINWTRDQIADARPFSPGGSYLNFPGVGEADPAAVRDAYGDNYAQLSSIKAAYDPGYLFRLNQNIAPGP